MDYRVAEFVRFVADHERLIDLLDEFKVDTWTKGREQALLVITSDRGERFVMVRGGADGILLLQQDDGSLVLEIENGQRARVSKLAWHVHPEPTGPSDHDRQVLESLKQESSMLYEIRGPSGGTRFYRTSRRI